MKQLIILIFFGALTSLSFGQELLTTSYFPLASNGLGSTLTVQDPLTSAGSGVSFNVDRRFRVELAYNRNSHSDLINALKWRLTLKVKNNAPIPQEETLVIDFTPQGNSTYSAWADFKAPNATDYSMTWSITSMTVEKYTSSWVPGTISDLPLSDIHLEAMVFNDRIVQLGTTAPKLSITNTNQLNWDHVVGAVEYDVEWVFIDLQEQTQFTNSTAQSPFDFKEPVRITTYKHSHKLDLIYPKGTLYFRIRPKGYIFRITGNKEVYAYGAWSYAKKSGAGNMSLAITTNFEGKKNWQYTVAYAENGMSASTVTYLDGSLRARQQLMQQKSTGQVVATASLYDYEGRSSVQVIPTPINTNSLSYYNNLHTDVGGGAFDKADFDQGTSSPMGTGSGAGRYYSSFNDITDPFRDRIPDAEGYPYSQVILSNDNLGRPKVSSGVGLTHRMGAGHESYYYYVKPTERDLRELFGSNVGNLSHYNKQIQIDPNGQASVSYSDQAGRTIATGLMASAPANLLPLDNNPAGVGVTSTSTLMPMNLITTDSDGNLQSVTDYTHFNLGSNPITLKYDMLAGGVNSLDEYFGTSCASCFYELEIKVYDPNGALVNLAYNSASFPGAPLSTIKERYSGAELDCESPTFNPDLAAISKTITLSVQGEYRIQKILRVDKAALLSYLSSNASSLPGAPILQDYLDEYADNAVTLGCGFDCAAFYEQECRQELGYPVTGALSSLSLGAQDSINACITEKCATSAVDGVLEDMENDPGQCDMLLGLLKQDISPGGWVFASYVPWRTNSANWDITYTVSPGVTFNPTSLQDLEDHWQDEWASVIVTTHPEYCHYSKCEALADIKHYAYIINSISTFAAAQPIYCNSSGGMVVSNDPISVHPLYSSGFSTFISNLNSNFQGTGGSIYDYVSNMAGDPAYEDLFKEGGIMLTGTALQNRIWNYVKSIYMGERNNFIENGYSPACGYIDDPSANFIDPATMNTTTGVTDLLGIMDDNCAQICANNVTVWMNEIEENCNGLTETELNTIREDLQNYCLTDCDGYTNPTGAIQLSDLSSNSDLHEVELLLESHCGEFTLDSIAVDNTCENPVTVTISGVYELGSALNKKLALLTSLAADLNGSTTHYTNFITSPLITAISSYTSEFSYLHWTSSAMILKLSNPTAGFSVSYDVNTIANIQILSYEVVPQTIPTLDKIYFTVKIDFLNGTSQVHVINKFGLMTKTGITHQFLIDEIEDPKTVSYEYCDPDLSEFETDFSLEDWINDCIEDILIEAETLGNIAYANAYEDFLNGLAQSFSTNCFGNLQEQFSITYAKQEYYYTLYYYDQAGSLVQTVPPAGVHIVPPAAFNADGVWNGTTEPAHLLKTIYSYNSLGQAFKTNTPDDGITQTWYNSAQQPRYSQTAQQLAETKYSYSRFDALGRTDESGVFTPVNLTAALAAIDDNTYPAATVSVPTYDVIKTIYHKQSVALNTLLGWNPKDLNNRVSAILKYEIYKGTVASYDHALFYNYDIHGNVKQLLTDYPLMGANNRYKTVDYLYDVYSGKVLNVTYQKDKQDQFMHRYTYDDDNRLTQVQTSADGIKWDADARYYYYLHGPVARMELGEDKVQGTDYAYTVHGWLKGINSNSGIATRDIGKDGGTQTHKNRYVAQDAIGFSLTYFNSGTAIDYKPIVTPSAANNWLSSAESTFLPGTAAAANLYNGNIRAMVTSIKKTDNTLLGNVVRVYKYDQLQRIKEAQTYTAANQVANNAWTGAAATNAHYSSYSFDLNGNLKSLNRRNHLGLVIDQFSYKYDLTGGTVGDLKSNRLYHLTDGGPSGTATDDIEDMGPFTYGATINTANNYGYDASGRLIRDNQEKISSITWNVMNKVSKITHTTASDKPDMEFRYNALGQRIAKIVKPKVLSGSTYIVNTSQIKTTYYAMDAQGNLIATYSQLGDVVTTFTSSGLNTTAMTLEDFHLYGASRLGSQVVDQTLSTSSNVGYAKNNNRASAIIAITNTTYTAFPNATYVQYRLGANPLHDPYQWNTLLSLDANLKGLMDKINANTFSTDVSASLWYDKNVSGTAYIQLNFSQPGIWANQSLSVYTNTTYSATLTTVNTPLTTGGTHIVRQFGYGTSKGVDVVGAKRYELSNHLGNVLSVITDRKWGVDDGYYDLLTGVKGTSTPDKITDYYLPTILTYSDYDPYGTIQTGRTAVGGEDYRYGYQGSEKDDELKGNGNSYTTEYRLLDPRIGRWLSMDPMASSRPSLTPYNSMSNNPISKTDPLGNIDDWVGSTDSEGKTSYKWKEAGYQLQPGEFFQETGYICKNGDSYTELGENGYYRTVSNYTYEARAGTFYPDKYYVFNGYGYGWEEASGLMSNKAVNGTVALLATSYLGEQMAIYYREHRELSYYEIRTRMFAQDRQDLEYRRTALRANGFAGVLYMFGGFETVDYAMQDIGDGAYLSATIGIGLEFIPFDRLASPLVRESKSLFRAFKRANPAGIGADGFRMEWHHMVLQHYDNLVKFGVNRIQHADNLVLLEKSIHAQITIHFNSSLTIHKQYYPHARDYVKTLDWDQQMKYMIDFMNGL